MPKKAGKNGFFYFMKDYKRREEKLGRRFPGGFNEIQTDQKCSDEWTNLPNTKKQEYNNLAKQKKKVNTSSPRGKLTTLGESVVDTQRQLIAQQQHELAMQNDIDEIINQADRLSTQELISFYFIHVNYYYTKTDLVSTVDYIPAEFAVCEFTIKDGIKRLHHQIISTEIELGYAREAMEISDSTHKLNWDLPEGEKDYKKLCTKLVAFLRHQNETEEKLPPLYTSSNIKTIVPCLFRRMTAAAEMPEDTFDLYSLEYLLGSYMEYLNHDFPTKINRMHIAEAELDKGAYVWSPKIECEYHAKIDGTKPYCSQAIIYQWAFTFCDYCCVKLGIKMRSGVHCPENLDYDTLTSGVQNVTLENQASSLKSDTGVSNAYRQKVSSRTREEEERRRNKESTFTIIDHSKLTQSSSSVGSGVPTYTPLKEMRRPLTSSKIVVNNGSNKSKNYSRNRESRSDDSDED